MPFPQRIHLFDNMLGYCKIVLTLSLGSKALAHLAERNSSSLTWITSEPYLVSDRVEAPDLARMAPPQVHGKSTPRLVLYQQTHHETKHGKEQSVSLLPLLHTGISHVIVSAIHLNAPAAAPIHITLNDHVDTDPRFDVLWTETRQLQEAGIKVMGMLGGAAQGSYKVALQTRFDESYTLLLSMIQAHSLDGIDLDVEEVIPIALIQKIITRLRHDMGPDFIITLAPVAHALRSRRSAHRSIIQHKLNPVVHTGNATFDAICRVPRLASERNLSGFDYVDLEKSEAGKMVNFYNLQFYNGWGDACAQGEYEHLISLGWQPERLVLGTLTNQRHGGMGHRHINSLLTRISELVDRYGDKFGGVMGWEYWKAGQDSYGAASGIGPERWVQDLSTALGRAPPPTT